MARAVSTTSSIETWPKWRYGERPLAWPSAGERGSERSSAYPRSRFFRNPRKRARAAGVPPGIPSTGGTVASRGKASTKAATSFVFHASKGAFTRFVATSGIRGFAAARCGQASAKALWMRGRRCAAADTAGPRSDSGTTEFESTAKTGTSTFRARASAWGGTMKQGKSSVTTRHARSESLRRRPRPWPFSVSTKGQ